MRAVPTILLEYGKRPPNRWRRLARWTIVAVLLVTLAFAGLFALRNLAVWVARRQGYAAVGTWYEQARIALVPAGTLLYSEHPDDLRVARLQGGTIHRGFGAMRGAVGLPNDPLLRTLHSDARRIPSLVRSNVLYVHEHLSWDGVLGSQPHVLAVSLAGTTREGQIAFTSLKVRPTASGRDPFAIRGVMIHSCPPGRSLDNLRIFAGAPHPTDRTRFFLPFDCDGGRGRFEFQTDVDARDGGQLAPSVRIEWDDAATRPATRPGAADAR